MGVRPDSLHLRFHSRSPLWRGACRTGGASRALFVDLFKEVVALVVDDNEGGKVNHLNAPHSLHAQFGVLQNLNLLNAVLGQPGCRAPDGSQIKAPVLLAGIGDLFGAVPLCNHDHAPTVLLEKSHVRVHPTRGGGPKGATGHPGRLLGGTGVIHGMVLDVVRKALARGKPLLQFSVGQVSRHHHHPGHVDTGLDGVLAQLNQKLPHRLREVQLHGLLQGEPRALGNKLQGVFLQLLNEDSVLGDLALNLAIRRARHSQADGAGGAMAGQPNHPRVMAEVLPSELRPNPALLCDLQHDLLHLQIPVARSGAVRLGGEVIEILRAGQLDTLQVELR
eukprot:RCo050966